jgi:hypothetical protein
MALYVLEHPACAPWLLRAAAAAQLLTTGV